MPLYKYECQDCQIINDIVKPMSESSREEKCDKCSTILRRIYTSFHVIGASVENAEYNPGLGCVVKNKRHREEIAKQRGLTEIGNDFGSGEKMQKHFEKKRKDEREKAWDNIKDWD